MLTVKWIVKGMEYMLMVVLAVMVIMVFGNVVLRYGFNSGIEFSEEVSRFLFIWLVFIGAVLVLRDNGHLGVHTLTKLLSRTNKRICKFIADAVTLACCVLLTYGAWEIIVLNWRNYAPISGVSIGVVYIACMVCSIGMGILLLNSIYRNITGIITDQELCPDFDDAL